MGDVPGQTEAARELIDGLMPDEPGFICSEVVPEVAWVLERSYDFTRDRVAEALMDLTASDSLVVENSDDVAAAAYRFRQGGVGFSDLMILKAAERLSYSYLRPQACPDARGDHWWAHQKDRRMTDLKPEVPQKSISGRHRRPTLDEVWPVHPAGGWPQDLSLDRTDIYEDRT